MSGGDGLDELSVALAEAGVPNELFHDCIHVALPLDAGTLEIKSWGGGGRSVKILQRGDARDLEMVAGEFLCAPQEAVALLLLRLEMSGVPIRTRTY